VTIIIVKINPSLPMVMSTASTMTTTTTIIIIISRSIHFREWTRTSRLFYSTIKRQYFLKPHSLYCCCKSTFTEWKVENVFF
jgi:hypothetical protein